MMSQTENVVIIERMVSRTPMYCYQQRPANPFMNSSERRSNYFETVEAAKVAAKGKYGALTFHTVRSGDEDVVAIACIKA